MIVFIIKESKILSYCSRRLIITFHGNNFL